MHFPFQVPEMYVRLGDFEGLKRKGHQFGGPAPDTLSDEVAEKVNTRWEEFYSIGYRPLMRFARQNEDLVQHGMLAVRGKLCQNPDVPVSHLYTCAKGEILNAAVRGIGCSIDGNNRRRQNPYRQKAGHYDTKTGRWVDVFEYTVSTSADNVENRVMLNLFYDSLNELEWIYVKLALEERVVVTGRGTCWVDGEYTHSAEPFSKCTPSPKKRWLQETRLSTDAYNKARWGAERKFRRIFPYFRAFK